MNKIEELLEKLCPNGVEYKTIGEIAKIQRGASPRPIKYYRTKEQNGINWIKIGDVEEGAKYITSTHEKITEEGAKNSRYIKKGSLILSNSMSFGRPYILAIDGCIHDGWLHLSNFEQFYKTDFLYFLLNSNKIQDEFKKKANFGGAVQNLNADIVRNIILPVPPLEIQSEIVRILDKFTELIALLKAELKARKQQYEYYREKLLTLEEENIPRKRLIDVSKISRGKRVTKKELNNSNKYPVYQNSLAPMGYYDNYNYEKNKTYIISAGSAGEIGFCKENFWAADDCLVIYDIKGLLDKFVYYYLLVKQDYILLNVRRAAIPRLPRKIIEEIEIPIPPIEKQKEIVDILDRFSTLCNDLTEGIPAEIEARQKQYEYYRDKLLTFKELNKE